MLPRWPVARAYSRVLGHAFVRGPGPSLLLCGLCGAVIFGPNGLDPRDMARMLPAFSLARAVAVVGCLVALRAGVRALLLPPSSTYLRGSTLPREAQLTITGALVLAATAPLPVVLLFGRAPATALTLWLGTAAACVAPRRWQMLLGLSASALPGLAFPLCLWLYVAMLRHAHREAPVLARRPPQRARRHPWPLAILAAAFTTVARSGPRALLATAAPVLGASLVGVADADARAERVLSLAAFVAALGATPLLSPIGRLVRAVDPLVRGAGRASRAALLVGALVVVAPSVAFAAAGRVLAHTGVQPLSVGVGLVVCLLVLERLLVARRRDAPLVIVLAVLPLAMLFTALARAGLASVAVALSLGALALPKPEVRRAEHR